MNQQTSNQELESAIYYRPHKHRNWKHEKYEVIVGGLIVNTVDTKNSAEILVNALRSSFTALFATNHKPQLAQMVKEVIGQKDKYDYRGTKAAVERYNVAYERNKLREEQAERARKYGLEIEDE